MSHSSLGERSQVRKKIIIFCDFYLPSMKSGGGTWTVVNLVDRFCDQYDFFVVTRNYDSKGDLTPYTTVKTGEWNQTGNARVFYVASRDFTRGLCAKLVAEVEPDAVFVNSVFSTPSVKFLMARSKGLIKPLPVILAPCGEFAKAALKRKALRKQAFLAYAKTAGHFSGVIWKASSAIEAGEIKDLFGSQIEIWIAPDLAPRTILPDFNIDDKPTKRVGAVKFIFFSRLVPVKNLTYFLKRLAMVEQGDVELAIVGPLEDQSYWQECKKLLSVMPVNINVRIHGAVSYTEGLKHLYSRHFFVLPTRHENFGYVILESLAAGSPVLISDVTGWSNIDQRNAGWQMPLDDPEKWNRRINDCIEMDDVEYRLLSRAARDYATEFLAKDESSDAMAKIISRALRGADRNEDSGQ